MTVLALALGLLTACSGEDPDWCAEREDDGDCDGVPDASDRCPNSATDQYTDRLGCTPTQASGCSIRALAPADGASSEGEILFRWETDCDITLLQFSDDPGFPSGATTTRIRTTATEYATEPGGLYWRLEAGLNGSSAGATTPPRALQ